MKVYGQLDNAQAEQVVGNPTPLSTGRFWADVTTAAKAILKFYDGTNVRIVGLQQTAALVSQNSGAACTVDWSTGLYQQVLLTGHCVISFSNPQSGQEHVLIVQQAALENAGAYKTPWQYKFNMTDQDSARGPYQPLSCLQTSQNRTYRWFYSTTIKAGYATVSVPSAAPSTLPASQSNGIDISPDGKYVASGNTTTPFSSVYRLYDAGQYVKYGNKSNTAPTAAAAAVNGLVYSPDGNAVFTSAATTPFIQGWFINGDGGPGTVMANPGTLPTGNAQCIAMHPSGEAVIVGHTTTPFMSGYPLTSGAYGTIYANAGTLPAAQVNAIAFSPTGDYVAASSGTTPFIQVWPFDPITGYGTVVANPVSLPHGGATAASGKGIAWRPQGDFIAMCSTSGTDNFLYVVGFNRSGSGAFGASVSTASVALTTAGLCCQWTPDGQYLVVGNATSPFIYVYDFSAGTLGAPITIDASATGGGQVNDLVIHPSGEYVTLSVNVSPFIKTFALPRKARNYLRLNPPGGNLWTSMS